MVQITDGTRTKPNLSTCMYRDRCRRRSCLRLLPAQQAKNTIQFNCEATGREISQLLAMRRDENLACADFVRIRSFGCICAAVFCRAVFCRAVGRLRKIGHQNSLKSWKGLVEFLKAWKDYVSFVYFAPFNRSIEK